MALSNKYSYTINKRQAIRDALIEAGVIADAQPVSDHQYEWMDRRLNLLIKFLQVKGLHLWKTKDITLLLEKGRISYNLGSTDNALIEEYVLGYEESRVMLINGRAHFGTTGGGGIDKDIVRVGDKFRGVEEVTGFVYYSEVMGFTDSIEDPNKCAITTGIPFSFDADTTTTTTIARGATVSYMLYRGERYPKPLRIHEAYVKLSQDGRNDIPINIIPRAEYFRLNDKSTTSYPVEIYFRPDINHSELKVWPAADNNTTRLVMSAELPLDDLTKATDEFSVPNWWLEPIHLALSHVAARGYNAPRDKIQSLFLEKEMMIREAMDFGVENTYVEIVPEIEWPS